MTFWKTGFIFLSFFVFSSISPVFDWEGRRSHEGVFLRQHDAIALTLDQIKKRGYLVVGVTTNHRPLSFEDDQGNLQGLEIDLIRRIAQELFADESAVKFVPLSNINRLQAVIDREVDITVASVSVNSFRYRIVDFSPYYYLSATAIVTKNKTINHLSSTHTLAVLEGSSAIALLKHHLPSVNLIGVKSYQEGLALVDQDKVTGFAADRTILTGWIQENPDYQLLSQVYGTYPLAIVLPKGLQHQKLRDQINQTLSKLTQEGWLRQRAEYWGLK